MFKFARNEELQATIDKQKDQIKRYENRLRDIVHAYKSLQNENEALENSMKALTAVAPSAPPTVNEKSTKEITAEDGTLESAQEETSSTESENQNLDKDGDNVSTPEKVAPEKEDLNTQHLRSQVFTLTQSLSTMSAEKEKIIATYRAEKKKLKQENEVQVSMLQNENDVFSKKVALLEDEISKVKEKVRTQQIDREQEQSTHSIMLREIQKMLNEERLKNESCKATIKQLRNAAQSASVDAQQSEDYKRRVRQLEDELDKVRKRLHGAEEEASKPPPLLLQLQEEMEAMKLSHTLQLEKEHARVVEMEEREREVAHTEEERVADLENRLIQISSKLGLYDGKMQKDQLSIQHLKDRISQLDIENTLLTKQLETSKQHDEHSEISNKLRLEDDDLDVDGLKEKIIKYQKLLKDAASKSNEPVDLTDFLASLQSDSDDYRKLYLESQENLLQLKEEHERYKTRAQNVLKNMKGGRSSSGSQDSDDIKRQLQEARERHFHLRSRCNDLEAKCSQMAGAHQRELEKLAVVHKSELESKIESHLRLINEKEREIRSQRERTIALLADKDKEIKQLKAYTSTYQSSSDCFSSLEHQRFNEEVADATEESLSEILSHPAQDKNIIHYAEQLARKDVMINSIRRHKKQLELQIRQLQDASITKDEKFAQELAVLKEKILDHERGTLRGNANMEYLKNVMYRYLISTDHTAKQKMLVALVTILQFSPEENRKVGIKR